MRVHVKFPCGYEVTLQTSVLDVGWTDFEMPDRCPIHNKECK